LFETVDIDYFLPLKNVLLNDYTSLEKILVAINVILFAVSFQCDVDGEVSTALIYIMFAIAYFVATTTCLTGAAQIKGAFSLDQNGSAGDNEFSKTLCEAGLDNPGTPTATKAVMKSNSATILKKQTAKKPITPLLRTDKKELQ